MTLEKKKTMLTLLYQHSTLAHFDHSIVYIKQYIQYGLEQSKLTF